VSPRKPARKTAVLERQNSEPSRPRGRPFPKGVSGNPGGRPKALARLKEQLLELSEEAVGTLKAMLGVPEAEMIANAHPLWVRALARERLGAVKVWFEFTVPRPSEDDPFKVPLPVALNPGQTTLELVGEARQLIGVEIARLRAVSELGHHLTPDAASRLTECTKQLQTLIEEELRLIKEDPFSRFSDQELERRLQELEARKEKAS
jgi:hypothetical protein